MKNSIPNLIKSRKFFFIGLLLLLLAGIFYSLVFGNTYNATHTFWVNVLFINYTFMGDAVFAISFATLCIFYFKRRKLGISILTAFLLTEFAVQLVKNFMSFSKPTVFFEAGQTILNTGSVSNGLLSGHTALAFALVTVLILELKNTAWQLPLLLGAALLGYSRIYLAQHAVTDILLAAMLGTCTGMLAVHFVYNRANNLAWFKNIFKISYNNRLPNTENSFPLIH